MKSVCADEKFLVTPYLTTGLKLAQLPSIAKSFFLSGFAFRAPSFREKFPNGRDTTHFSFHHSFNHENTDKSTGVVK